MHLTVVLREFVPTKVTNIARELAAVDGDNSRALLKYVALPG